MEGKVMTHDKVERHVICGSAILLLLFAGLTLFVVSIVRASHGPDGSGSEVGKTMNVPDLRSPAVQKRPDAELAQVIANGKGGMPPFKNSLSEDQIHSMVSCVRSLHQKK